MGLNDQDVRNVAEYLKGLGDDTKKVRPPDGTGPDWLKLTGEDFVNVNCHDDTWRWEDGAGGVVLAVLLPLQWAVAQPFKIPSGSMEPTLYGNGNFFTDHLHDLFTLFIIGNIVGHSVIIDQLTVFVNDA